MSNYTQMWSDLGLDLMAQHAPLSIPRGACHDIFLSQRNRPESLAVCS
jgi:hypothetical protein